MFLFRSSRGKLLLYIFAFIGLKAVEVYLMSRGFFEPFGSDILYSYRWTMGLILFYVLCYFLMGYLGAGFFRFDLFTEDKGMSHSVFYTGLLFITILPIVYYSSIRFFSFYPTGYNGIQPPLLFFSGMAARVLLAGRSNKQKGVTEKSENEKNGQV